MSSTRRKAAGRGGRPTQLDVARLAGVSQAMVSYVINNTPGISVPEPTRQRVLDAIETLGYVPNSSGRNLRTRRTMTIAGIIPDITNPFYPSFERGVQDIADRHGYSLITCNTDGVRAKELKCLQLATQGQVDGMIGVFFHVGFRDFHPLLERNIPIVRAEPAARQTGPYPLDNVFVDNVAAAYTATSHLISHGHRRIGMLVGHSGPQQYRIRGYERALAEHDIDLDSTLIQGTGFQEDDGLQGMRALLRQTPRPSAVFAANDLIALGAISAIREFGLDVPGDISIVGVDDIPAVRFVAPPLTTISLFPDQLGRKSAEMLLQRLDLTETGPGRCEPMPFELIVRRSVVPPRGPSTPQIARPSPGNPKGGSAAIA